MSSAVMMVAMAGASWTVVTPLAAVVTMFCRSMVVPPLGTSSASVVGVIWTSGGTSCPHAAVGAATIRNPTAATSFHTALLHHDQFHAPILGAPLTRRVGVEGTLGSVADRLQPPGLNPVLDQILAHRLGALLRDALLRGCVARIIGVAFDAHHPDLRVALEAARDLVEQLGESALDLGAANPKQDLLRDLELTLAAGGHVGTAVVVVHAVEGFGLVGTLVQDVRDAVAVVVGVGAAVVVLEAVAVLGLVGTLVERIRDAVLIVVGIGASVRVLEPVPILGLIGAQILRVRDAVVVAVAAQHGA